jgi:exo-1,4-beta-D-glucosaminidase
MLRRWLVIAALILASLQLSAQKISNRIALHQNWSLQNGCKIDARGDAISTAGFKPKGWYPTTIPMTVVAALVNNKVLPDPYYGMNLRSFPGMNYPVGAVFANHPMPDDSPFKCSWWYRTDFHIPTAAKGKKIWLHFDGINYRATIWLNGIKIAGPDRIAGAYRSYEFEVSDALNVGTSNVLAVEVTAQTEKDLGINWVDWNPAPPDKNMGLYRDAYLTMSGPVALRSPQVLTKLDTDTLSNADLTITAELTNLTDRAVSGNLQGEIGELRFNKPIELAAGEIRNVVVSAEEFKQLHIAKPRVWWPAQMGRPEMYQLELAFKIGTQTSDSASVNFGIRQVTSELTEEGYRLFRINGKKILIRGAGWAGDMLQRDTPQRKEQELRYVKDMGLNTVRLEGTLESDDFFDLADKMGILVMPGWCCCSHWEKWDQWTPADKTIALESLRTQISRMRNHPSVFVWLNGSDNPPPPEIEGAYLDVEKELNWPNPVLSSATAQATPVTGKSGVKMTGPYEYVPPMYWTSDTERKHGGAYGFNTETSPGPAPLPVASIHKMLPKEHWWPIDEVWNFHAGSGEFKTLDVFNAAMEARYGAVETLADYSKRAQVMAYDNERAMFEAYSGNKYTSTGVIQWMLNNSWPSLIWHLYDYYLLPAGGYFGTKKACEPVHIQYSYGDNSVSVVNSTYAPVSGAIAKVTVYNFDMTSKFNRESIVNLEPDSSTALLHLPEIDDLSPTYFLRLDLTDSRGKSLSTNFYWLSTTLETLDWSKTNYYVTPVIQQGNLKTLTTLPRVELKTSATEAKSGAHNLVRINIENPSHTLGFAVSLRVTNASGEDVVPILMEDNYFSLLPGEKRTVSLNFAQKDLRGPSPLVHVDGWNIAPSVVQVMSHSTAAK